MSPTSSLMHKKSAGRLIGERNGTKIYTNYPTLSKAAIGAMIQRIDRPYGTDYAKDADYIQAVQSGKTVRQSDYGTSGTIYTEKRN